MAGSVPVAASRPAPAAEKKDETAPSSADSAAGKEQEETSGPSKKTDLKLIEKAESQGILSAPAEGSLGNDVWLGSKRSLILSDILATPAKVPYRAIQDLVRRLLLTESNLHLAAQDEKLVPGRDFATLRLEKLLEMGNYRDSFLLYSKAPEASGYPDDFIIAGILAALYGREPSLACLEFKNVDISAENLDFKTQIAEICDYILSKMTGATTQAAAPSQNSEGSRILGLIEKDRNYRFTPSSVEDLKDLTLFDMISLIADDRLDLKNIAIPADSGGIPAHALSLLIESPSLPEESAFALLLQAAKQGLKTPKDIETWYLDKADVHFGKKRTGTSLTEYRKLAGWQRAPYIHRAATHAKKGAEQNAVMTQAFALSDQYGTAVLWPLAEVILSLDPQPLPEKELIAGFKVLVETGQDIPAAWSAAWHAREKNFSAMKKNEKIDYLAYGVGQNTGAEQSPENADISTFFKTLPPLQQEIIKISYEKLDNGKKLHNDSDNAAYENDLGLTSSSDYVMPNAGLLDRLKKAELDQRPGEVILLSSIALRDMPPASLQPGLYSGVIDGLIAVGLTKEARLLATEAMLGMIEN